MRVSDAEVSIRGDRIRELREERGMSQEALAERIGRHQTRISKWETGEETGVSIVTLVRLAGVLRCSIDYLLGLSNQQVPDAREAIKHGTLLPVKLLAHIRRQGSAAPPDHYTMLAVQDLTGGADANDLILAQALGKGVQA